MKILLLGSGGRESAFAWKLSQSSNLTRLYIAPGNGGTDAYGTNVPIQPTEFDAIQSFVLKEEIDLVLVGPEEPLVKGIHDYFLANSAISHIPIIGPKKDGAILEGSKDFSKKFMQKYNVPTAASKSFTSQNLEEGLQYIAGHTLPIVLKADGLAAGKGVLICEDREEALQEFKEMLGGKFGNAGNTVVIEQFLKGIELSVFVLCDGQNYLILPEAKDYKRIGEGDTGLNTGGMGSVSPVPFADATFMRKVEEKIIIPTIKGLRSENIDYKGFIFIGLMNDNGNPYVIEYNCRMGDPETESVLLRIENDLVPILNATAQQKLNEITLKISPKTAATVMIVSGGYPGPYLKGKEISGLENIKNSHVFHAGTSKEEGHIKNTGGRVLAISTLQNTLFEALQNATADAGRVYFDGKNFRKDIGFDLI